MPAENRVASPPRNLTATRTEVSWDPPATTYGLTIRDYWVDGICNGELNQWLVTNPVTTSLSVDLAEGVHCTFTVRADTDAGQGEWSNPASA